MLKAYPRHSVNLSWAAFREILKKAMKGQLVKGPEQKIFEEEFARYMGVKHAIGVFGGRAGLFLALKSLELEQGDEVIMPAYTFHIVPLVVEACGLKPIFVDVRPDTYNLDCSLVEPRITARTRAILVAHFYGQAAEMEPLLKIAERHKLRVIEDCAHACGGEYRGKKLGSLGDIGVFSFALAKNMPCFGGGMITTNDDVLARKIRDLMDSLPPGAPSPQALLWKNVIKTSLSYFCTRPLMFSLFIYPMMRVLAALKSSAPLDTEPGTETISEQEKTVSLLYRLTNLQSAVGLHQLSRLDALNEKARVNASIYNRELQGLPWAQLPVNLPESKHCYLYYRIQVDKREDFRREMLKRGIDTAPDDMSDCTQLSLFKDQAGSCPVAQKLPLRIVEIPNNQDLREKDLLRITRVIRQCDLIPQVRKY